MTRRTPAPLGAGAPLRLLTRALADAGWGPYLGTPHGRAGQVVLRALADRLNPYTAEGTLTLDDLMAATGYSRRWLTITLHRLHDRGLIAWRPGGVERGRCVSSWVRVSKAALHALIAPARAWADARRAAWRLDRLPRVLDRQASGLPLSPPYVRRRWAKRPPRGATGYPPAASLQVAPCALTSPLTPPLEGLRADSGPETPINDHPTGPGGPGRPDPAGPGGPETPPARAARLAGMLRDGVAKGKAQGWKKPARSGGDGQ